MLEPYALIGSPVLSLDVMLLIYAALLLGGLISTARVIAVGVEEHAFDASGCVWALICFGALALSVL